MTNQSIWSLGGLIGFCGANGEPTQYIKDSFITDGCLTLRDSFVYVSKSQNGSKYLSLLDNQDITGISFPHYNRLIIIKNKIKLFKNLHAE